MTAFRNVIISLGFLTGITLIIQMDILPSQIREAMMPQKVKDTTIIYTPPLPNMGNLFYFDGEFIGENSINIKDEYGELRGKMFEEINNGWVITARSNHGGKYLIWSKNKISLSADKIVKINGVFFNPNSESYQTSFGYLEIIIPVTETTKREL